MHLLARHQQASRESVWDVLYLLQFVGSRSLGHILSRKLAKLAGVTLAIARFLSTGCKS